MLLLVSWSFLLVLALLAGQGGAQSCRPELQGKGSVPWSDAARTQRSNLEAKQAIVTNMARGLPAFQSSIYPHEILGTAAKAVDGNCDGNFHHASCTHTNLDPEPWWYVDLGGHYFISAVVVKNREDCCAARLQGAEIHVGDSVADHGKSNPLCGVITDPTSSSICTIFCNWLRGRYVSIVIPGRAEYLHVCEVEVYGSKQEQC